MPVVKFSGRILPNQMKVSLADRPKFSMRNAETIADTVFEVEVIDSRLTVIADTTEETDFTALFFHAYDLARSLCDVLTTPSVVVHLPLLDMVELPDGQHTPTILADRRLGRLFSVHEHYDFEAILELVVTDIRIARLLADVTSMLTWTHYAPIAAGRVAESIRVLLTGGRSAADWATMRDQLNIDRDYLQLLTDHSTPPRHGDRQYVDAATNSKLAERAWTLADRFLTFRLGGSKALDEERYPRLMG
jgi:hypothetical protein